MDETKDWIANAREDFSRRQFLTGVGTAGVSLAGFAIAATPVAGQVIATSTEGLVVADSKVQSGDFQVPIYEARPAGAGRCPVVLILPEAFGMHEHIKDIARRLAPFRPQRPSPRRFRGRVRGRLPPPGERSGERDPPA